MTLTLDEAQKLIGQVIEMESDLFATKGRTSQYRHRNGPQLIDAVGQRGIGYVGTDGTVWVELASIKRYRIYEPKEWVET